MLPVLTARTSIALALLGFSCGLPYLLASRTLQFWMSDAGASMAAIGWFGYVLLPYSLKFLWAPLLDHYALPFLGRRRGWILVAQALLAVLIALLGALLPGAHMVAIAGVAAGMVLVSASQDIVVDAHRADVLAGGDEGARGRGVSRYVLGYRVGMMIAWVLAPVLAPEIGWRQVYLLIAALMAVGAAGTFLAPEPPAVARPATLEKSFTEPLAALWRRFGRTLLPAALFIALFKLGDQLVGALGVPFLKWLGFSGARISIIQGTVGLAATAVGALVGGVLIGRIGTVPALFVCGALQAISNLGYWWLAEFGGGTAELVAVVAIENLCGGLGTAAFLAYLLALCEQRYSATQFALLSSLAALAATLLAGPSGVLQQGIGWSSYFYVSLLAGLPALSVLWWARRAAALPPVRDL